MAEVERSIAKVEPLLQRYGYAASFVAVLGEGMGIPLPGGTLLIASALDAAKGGMNIGVLLVMVTLAAWLGNSIGYLIGRWGGRSLLEKLRVNQQYLKRVEGLFDRRGGVIILIARFVDGLRQLNGIVAGILEMPWRTFTLYNVAGALLYVLAWGLGAFVLEKDIHIIVGIVHQYRALSVTLSIAAFAALLVYLFQRKRT